MNQRLNSIARHTITFSLLLLGQLCALGPIAHGQPPMLIPPGAETLAPAAGQPEKSTSASLYYRIKGNDDHLKMVVNTSRFLTLDQKIPQVQVNNPDLLDVAPISPNQIQISAKHTGVTQVNVWGEDKRIYTVTVTVTGDAAELTEILKEMFPRASLSIVPINGNAVIISGYVDQQDAVPKIVAITTKYFPNVINNMTISGAQICTLHVKVFEVSRTKLRNMGFDWANISNDGNHFVMSGVSGLLQTVGGGGAAGVFGTPSNAPDNAFKIQGGSFYAVLSALRADSLAKLDAEPDLVAISGRPAYMLVGGEIGYQVSSTVAGNTVGWKQYGTRLDYVPVMLGNGRMHIDVRASVSALDASNGIDGIPALTNRETETGVELRAGQTLAIAGLIQHTVEASNSGFPWISEVPYLGAAFRSVSHSTNEIEMIVLITPELVDGMQPGQVPACMPGMETTNPGDWELFFKGHLEVPNCCPVEPVACRSLPAGDPSAGPNLGEWPPSPQNPQNRAATNQMTMSHTPGEPGFIGPIGYDVLK